MPKATVVICTLNREKQLSQVLSDLSLQNYKDFEIIISHTIGITNAMNQALNSAHGEIIIRVDDDVILPFNWLAEIMETFDKYPDAGGVTGPTIVPEHLRKNRDLFSFDKLPQPLKWLYVNYFQEGNPYATAHMNKCGAFSLGSNFETALSAGFHECDYLESTNYALRTALVKAEGGWDPKFDGVCEYFEQDMVYKLKKKGWKMYYNPAARMYHMVDKGGNFNARMDYISRLRNWCRFVCRYLGWNIHTISYLFFQIGYYVYTGITRKSVTAKE